MNVAECNKH